MNDHLDINTPRGQVTLSDEMAAIALFQSVYPNSTYIKTAKDGRAIIDGLIARDGTFTAIVETKCRYDLTLDAFQKKFNSEWLVTFNKIEGGRRIADALIIPFWGFMYLVDDKLLLAKELYNPNTGWQATFRVVKTPTRATCNGGTAMRDNAYIDMRNALIIKAAT